MINTIIFSQENEFESVCKMAAIPRCLGLNAFEKSRWEQNGRHFAYGVFKCNCLERFFLFRSISWPSGAHLQYVIIDSGNDLVPNKRQAIN